MLQTVVNGRYRVIQVLGEGGFGKTYLTQDAHMPSGRLSVMKVLKPVASDPQMHQMVKDRFQREAAILEDLGNSNNRIPKLYAYFTEQGEYYLIQEYIQGKTLTQKVFEEGTLSDSAVREILRNLLFVLNFVHSKQIIHRDIKPDNIIIRDSDRIPVLIDFGAVRESMGTVVNSQGRPTSSIVIGTPGFMPSEQAAGRAAYNSDLYSLGLTMVFLLTGKMPQELPTDPRTGAILWHQFALNVSPSLRIVLDKAIAPYQGDRYATAREMLDALQQGGVNVASGTPSGQNHRPPDVTVPVNNQAQYISYNPNSSPNIPNQVPQQQNANPNIYTPPQMVGGGGTFNDSVVVPPEIEGWNWGAFLVSGFWVFSNRVWIGLLVFIPYAGWLMLPILGAKGNVWAWKSRQWRSLEDFKAHQRAWAIAGVTLWSASIVLFGLLAAIGSMHSDTSTSTPEPTPTLVASSSPEPTTTPSPSSSTDEEVAIDNLKSYSYKNNLFSIDVPSSWDISDQSKPGEVSVLWQDKSKLSIILVNLLPAEGQQSEKQLSDLLEKYVKNALGKRPDFTIERPVVLDKGIIRVVWSFSVPQSGGKKVTLSGNSFIAQRGNKLSIYSNAFPEKQFSKDISVINQINYSYKVDPDVALP